MAYSLIGHQIDIGRTDGDLLFDDPHLAPRHARIVVSPSGWVLSPLELRNGVYLRLRGPVDLNDGDYFLIGKQVMRYEVVAEAERGVHAAIEHGVALFGTPTRPAWAACARSRRGVSRATCTISAEARWSLAASRETSCFPKMSSCHDDTHSCPCALAADDSRIWELERQLHPPARAAATQLGDLIRLGDELLRFELG